MALQEINIQSRTVQGSKRNGQPSGGTTLVTGGTGNVQIDFPALFAEEMSRWFVRDTENKALRPADVGEEAYGLYSNSYISAKGANDDAGGTVSGVTELSKLSDVQLGTLADGQVLTWDVSSQKWVNKTLETGLDETALADYLTSNQYVTQQWMTGALDQYVTTEDLTEAVAEAVSAALAGKVDTSFFARLLAAIAGDGTEISVNDMETVIASVKVKFGLWSGSWISAKGQNPDAGGTVSGATDLDGLSDVTLTNLQNGQVLMYNGSQWVNSTLDVGLDETALAQYLTSHLYATQSWVTSQNYATEDDLDARIDALVNGAPAAFDTLKEIADVLQGNVDSIGDILTALGNKADKTITITAGAGLTGGGNLSANRTISLATVGTAGTYTKVTVDAYGRVTGHSSLVEGDIPALGISKITGLQTALDAKLDAATFNDLFEKVEISTGVYAIRAKYGLYSNDWISTKGANPDAGGVVSGASKLTELEDVSVSSVAYGQVLTWDVSSQKWVNKTLETGLDETALAQYLTNNQYLTMPTGDARYVTLATAQTISGEKTFANSLSIKYDVDTSRVYGINFNDTSNETMGSIGYLNVSKFFFINPIGSSNPWQDSVGKYNLIIGNNKLTYNTYPILTSNNYTSYIGNSFVKKAGDTMTGTLTLSTTGSDSYNQGIRINRTALNQWATLTIGYVGTATAGSSANTWLIGTPSSSNSLVFNLNSASESAGLCLKGHGNTDMKWNNQTVWHAGNDGSGSGLDADLLDGYHRSNLYGSVDTWLSVVGLTKTITVTGDKNTYYPVEITVSSSKRIPTIISIHKDLGSTTPDISGNHSNGTSSLWLIYEMRKTSWDGNGGFVRTVYKSQPYATLVANAKNNTNNGGNLIVWLRGGTCSYQVTCTNTFTATPYYTTTNVSHQTGYTDNVSPTTSISNGGIFGGIQWYGNVTGNITGNAATATQLQTARTINGTAFNGTSNIVTSYWGALRAISLTGNVTGSVAWDGSRDVTMTTYVNYATSAGNADTLDSLHATAFARADQSPTVDLNTVNGSGIMTNSANANATTARHYPIQEAGTLFYGTAAYSSANQIYGTYSSNRWFFRGAGSSTTSKTAWKEMAFLTSNVASASKLQTARTIWGRPFDGTANVSGNMTGVGSISASGNITTDNALFQIDATNISGDRGLNVLYNGQRLFCGFGTSGSKGLYIAHSGSSPGWVLSVPSSTVVAIAQNSGINVGIGTTSPSYKLHVAGDIYATSWLRTNGQTGWYSQTYGGGWYMTDTIWLRAYNGKSIYTSGRIQTDTSFDSAGSVVLRRLGYTNSNLITWEWTSTYGDAVNFYIPGTNNQSVSMKLYSVGGLLMNGLIHATGGIYSDSYVSAKGNNSSSDIRLKNILCPVRPSLEAFAKAPLFRFAWKSNPDMVEIGSSAQYWKNVLPDTVKERDGWLEMGYGNIALAGVITIARDFETLEQRVDRLEKENGKLKKRIKELERRTI